MSTFPRGIWLAYAAIATLLALQALVPALNKGSAPPPPGATSTIAADFVAAGAIELSRVSREEAYALVFVRNDSSQPVEAAVQATALDRHGNELSGAVDKRLDPHTTTHVKVRLSAASKPFDQQRDDRLPARGYVTLRVWPQGQQHTVPTVKFREIVVPQVQPSSAERQITIVAVAAGLLVLLFGIVRALTAKPNAAIQGTPKWTPQSWSTNLAIGGALLTGVLAIGGLPAQGTYATKASYTALSAYFAALVALAPAVYGLMRLGAVSEGAALRLFSVAAAITVWGTVGQLGTAALVCLELGMARVLSGTAAIAAAVLFCAVAALVWLHALRAVHAYSTQGGSPAAVRRRSGTGETGGPVPPPADSKEWPLL
jgi:hypothetical protein